MEGRGALPVEHNLQLISHPLYVFCRCHDQQLIYLHRHIYVLIIKVGHCKEVVHMCNYV